MSYPDLEVALSSWLKSQDLATDAGTVTPSVIPDGFVRVTKGGGTDDTITDSSIIDVDVFHSSRGNAFDMSEAIRDALTPRTRVGSAIIDRVRTGASPRQMPWDNTNIKRFSASYTISVRRD